MVEVIEATDPISAAAIPSVVVAAVVEAVMVAVVVEVVGVSVVVPAMAQPLAAIPVGGATPVVAVVVGAIDPINVAAILAIRAVAVIPVICVTRATRVMTVPRVQHRLLLNPTQGVVVVEVEIRVVGVQLLPHLYHPSLVRCTVPPGANSARAN